MSHNIMELDRVQGIEQAWHGLSEVVERIDLRNNPLSDWNIEPRKAFIKVGDKEIETPFSVFTCSDHPETIIGKAFADDTYGIVDNHHFLNVIEESLKGISSVVASIGSVRNRGRLFCSIKIDNLADFESAGRNFEPYLNFITSHDQSTAFIVNTSNICTVCDNTLSFNILHKGQQVDCRFVHRKGIEEKIANLPEIIDAAIGVQKEFALALERLSNQKVTNIQARDFSLGFLHGKTDEPLSTRRINIANRLCDLFRTGKGNRGENKADLLQAGTDYFSHESSGGENRMKQFSSSEFGVAATQKRTMLRSLTDNSIFSQTIELGQKAIEKTRQGNDKEKARLDNLLFVG